MNDQDKAIEPIRSQVEITMLHHFDFGTGVWKSGFCVTQFDADGVPSVPWEGRDYVEAMSRAAAIAGELGGLPVVDRCRGTLQ